MYFNFEDLINKYSAPFTLVTHNSGQYVGGKWQEGEPVETTLNGAIISYSQNKIYQSGGTLTQQDRVLYMLTAIDKPLKGAKIKFEGNEYSIEADRQKGNEKFTGVYAYTLKWVSAFD